MGVWSVFKCFKNWGNVCFSVLETYEIMLIVNFAIGNGW